MLWFLEGISEHFNTGIAGSFDRLNLRAIPSTKIHTWSYVSITVVKKKEEPAIVHGWVLGTVVQRIANSKSGNKKFKYSALETPMCLYWDTSALAKYPSFIKINMLSPNSISQHIHPHLTTRLALH